MLNSKQFGHRVLISRRDLDWKQEELASRSGVSRSRISEIERGDATNIGVDAVYGLAEALGVSVSYLLGASESPLSEDSAKVLAEQSEEYVVFEVDSGEQRRLFREIIDAINALPPATQRMVLALIRTMRQVEEEQARELPPPRVIGQ